VLISLYYEEVYNLNAGQRGIISAIGAPVAAAGLMAGIPLAGRLMLQDPGIGLRLVAVIGFLVGSCFVVIAVAPALWIAIVAGLVLRGVGALILPSAFAALSLAIPPKVRSLGFSMSSVFVLPGLIAIVLATYIADHWGIRQGVAFMGPVFFIGAVLIATAGKYVKSDINRVWTATATQAEALYERRQGRSKLLLVRNVDVAYDQVQVLFGVNFEVDEGEIVALLGTNGAGKSTLLKTICGITEATNGAVVFDGRDATYAPPNEIAARGVVLMPGGSGVFPGLTVAENLRLAGWTQRRDRDGVARAHAQVLDLFPVLRERLEEPAGNLSGGQQQMLALGMAFIMKPRLLMIDELSLGLAPVVVEQLLRIVHQMRGDGITIILVEQSVNLALSLAETAFFMEKGEIRFHGPTRDLLDRPDILRSVFLEGAATVTNASAAGPSRLATSVARNGDRPDRDSAPTRLVADGIAKRFGGLQALDDVSFVVGAGEIVGFLGPNGAGKTTLFDVICGFTPGDGGRYSLDGRDLTGLAPQQRARLGLGRSFQDGRLFPNLTVHETVAIALERSVRAKNPLAAAMWWPTVLRSERRINARVDELLELMSITDFRDKLVRELSTGSKRIVDLACVMAHEPTVLLLDEPSSGIAQREAEALGPLLLNIRDRMGASLMVIEHDVPLMLSVADRVIALDLGRVVADGEPHAVVHDPAVIASYLGGGEAVARSGTTTATT
jgi:branched-chain amino acid transport system ATP-binding protein